jgi:hypothetical protein
LTGNCNKNSKEKDLEAGASKYCSRGNEKEDESTNSQSNRGGNDTGRGRGFGRGKGKYIITCYRCGVEGHKASECLESTIQEKEVKPKHRLHRNETSIVGENVMVLQQEKVRI